MQIVESVESTPDWEAREERGCSEQRALAGHGLDMEDLASMCERQCRKACNLRSAAEELEETGSNGPSRRYWKRGSPKPAAEARAMETDPSPVRLWSAADSEGHSEGYRTAYPSESEEMARLPTGGNTAPEPSLEHEAGALERPARARTAPVARHTEPTRDNMGDTPMAEESEAPGTVGCARSGGKHVECHCEHVSFLIGKYPKMGMDAIVQHLDHLDNAKDGLEENVAGILDDQSAAERDMAEQDRYRSGNFYVADITDWDMIMGYDFMVETPLEPFPIVQRWSGRMMNALHGCPRTMHADHPNGMLRKRIGSSERCKLWVPSPEETTEFSSRSMEWRRRCMTGLSRRWEPKRPRRTSSLPRMPHFCGSVGGIGIGETQPGTGFGV